MDAKLRKLKKRKRADDYDEEDFEDDTGTATSTKGGKNSKRNKNGAPSSSSTDRPVGMSGIRFRNKQRTLVFSSRGTNAQFRHLMLDFHALLPHHKKESKMDIKKDLRAINEICDIKGCGNCIFFEVRKRRDLFMWLSKAPTGPSAKFHVENIHTMDELKLTGNCLKGSRPLLSFDSSFEDPSKPHLALLREVFTQALGTPLGHPKSKPFVDHVISLSYLDGRIWFRNFQIIEDTLDEKTTIKAVKKGKQTTNNLVEIGPRFCLRLARIFSGSFGGQTLYQNQAYRTPNEARKAEKAAYGTKYSNRRRAKDTTRKRKENAKLPATELDDVFS